MIRVLFIHQNLPGQFRRLMRYLQTRPDYHVVAIGEETAVRREPAGPALRVIGYARPDGPGEKTHHYLRHVEGGVRRAYRGFHVFMRSLPRLLAWNPELQVIVGGDGVSYGRRPPQGHASYREALMAEQPQRGGAVDWSRVHFLGKVPCATCRSASQVASLHIYLTYPFVLSWSMLEAMAVGVPVLGSDTARLPVYLDLLKPLAATVPTPAYEEEVA